MAIPPFPSHDLAKLVLGYLAEEQLMTAYDEFLQASPYLDVLKNEYDRIFMTSLKNILAEYRAVKIYVETCKPFLLRKKIFQCSNLLEVVKFLINHVDINKLQPQETISDKPSYVKQTYTKSSTCNICNSQSLGTCVCVARAKPPPTSHLVNQIEASTLQTSTEATSLADLPGNSVTEGNPTSEVVPVVTHSQTSSSERSPDVLAPDVQSSTCVVPQLSTGQQPNSDISLISNRQDVSSVKSDESREKIEEFNTIFNLVCSNNNSTTSRRSTMAAGSCADKPVCGAGTFQEFVTGAKDKEKAIVPDSSTSEHSYAQSTPLNNKRTNINPITNIKGPPVAQYLFKAGTPSNPYFQGKKEQTPATLRILPKNEEPKITILSDVKVDKFKPPVLQPSTPSLKTQTIFINGTPAYEYKQHGQNYSFTRDEIIAMPTIILVPSTGPLQSTSAIYSQSKISCSTNTMTSTTDAIPRPMSPLVIDISNDPVPTSKPSSNNLPDLNTEDSKTVPPEGLIKTVDVISHGSLPKDTNLAVPNKTSTPNALPPSRKSSSTPRRNSHVRVLDFATPRRILHDPNQLPSDSSANINPEPPDVPVHINIVTKVDEYGKLDSSNKVTNTSTKENKTKSAKQTRNWDADLRALVSGESDHDQPIFIPKSSNTTHKKRKSKKVSTVNESVTTTPEIDEEKKSSKKEKKSKKKKKSSEEPEKKETDNPKSEDIKDINESVRNDTDLQEKAKTQVKPNTSDECADTPETERLSLQNAIGAKLNISDFLETPYKQALYDIQMETPKFLGPDLPDDPISDIKIMSIPTPRFLNTPKPLQATPSSYSSRPTDYSSGGSYYKPDDHDYIPSTDVLQCTVSEENMTKSSNDDSVSQAKKDKNKSDKPSRPKRKCAKNVSYKSLCKYKEDEMLEAASVSSETSIKSAKNKNLNKSTDSKSNTKSKSKRDSKKKNISYKSPHKPKNFMKIKPRRPTPIKESASRGRKKIPSVPDSNSVKSLSRKGTTSKGKSTNTTPVLVAVPTKSRRKSSTPRKLNCTKSEFLPESVMEKPSDPSINEECVVKETTDTCHLQDSDTEQQPLRWSDDGSQDAKPKEELPTSSSLPDEDDITKIKEYIETSAPSKHLPESNVENLHVDLINRGFDVETAKSIERDLLDSTPIQDTAVQSTSNDEVSVKKAEASRNVSNKVDSDSSTANNLEIEEDAEGEDIELSTHDCNEESDNFVCCQFDESKFVPSNKITKLKDKFSMELCIDDDVTIRLRATQFISLFDVDPEEIIIKHYNPKETEDAVSSISNIDKLYTPMKDHKAQYYELFDSTLTSIDTPIKADVATAVINETKVAEIALEVENVDVKEKTDTKKRKRLQSGGNTDESLSKKSKPDTKYLFNSANIQNIDIESVLSKLHGP